MRSIIRHRSTGPGTSDQVGAAAVEFALVMPLLIMLGYGVIQFGILFAQDLAIGNGAREGARFGATSPDVACNDGTATDLVRRIRAAADTSMLDTSQVMVDVYVGPTRTGAEAAGAVCGEAISYGQGPCEEADPNASPPEQVYVVTTYQAQLSIPFASFEPIELSGNGVFRCEY